MKKLLYSILTLYLIGCCKQVQPVINYNVIPQPQSIDYTHQSPFVLDTQTFITYPQGDSLQQQNAIFLASYLKTLTGLTLYTKAAPFDGKQIALSATLPNTNKEAYQLTVTDKQISRG